jgi:molybdate transport system substrate-binding protein
MRLASIGAIAALALATLGAWADEIRVVTVGGLQKPIEKIAADYARETGNSVKFTFTNPALLQKTLSEGAYDVIVVADAPVADLEKANRLKAGSRAAIVRGGIGVAAREDATLPDIATPEALKAALLAAKSIVYTDPATPNGSGEKTRQILEAIGVWDAVVAKGRVMGLGPAKEAVAKGDFDIGLFNASEAEAPGCVLAGIIPAAIQRYTNYDAGVMENAANAAVAAGFVGFLTGSAAATRWREGKMSPTRG